MNDNPGRQLADLLQRLLVGGFARLDDQVANAELLDEGHDLLLRPGANRQHRDDRGHTEDHPQHREEGSELVRAEVLEAEHQLGQEIGRPEVRARAHLAAPDPVGSGPADDLPRWAER